MSAGVIASSGGDFSSLILARSPLVYWKFDETGALGTRTAADASGNGRTGTMEFMTYGNSRIVAGTSPGLTVANADNSSRIYTAHASWMDATAMTALVIHRPALSTTGYIMSIDDGGSGNAEMSWNVLRVNDGSLQFQWRNAGGTVSSISSAAHVWALRAPYVISASLSATAAELYLDGVLVASGAGQAPRVGTGMLRVENLNGTGFPGQGAYDEYAYFGSHLSAADHLLLSNAAHGADRTPNTGSDGLVWRMNPDAVLGGTKLYTSSTGTSVTTGGNAYVARCSSIPAIYRSGATPHSMEIWFSKPAAAVHGTLFKFNDCMTPVDGWGVCLGASGNGDNDGHALQFVRDGVAWGPDIVTTLATGNHHLVVTRNGSTFKAYVDGTLLYNGGLTGLVEANSVSGMCIGGYYTSRMLPNTVPLDKFATYGTELSAAQVTAHYNGGAGSDSAVAADSPLTLLELDARS